MSCKEFSEIKEIFKLADASSVDAEYCLAVVDPSVRIDEDLVKMNVEIPRIRKDFHYSVISILLDFKSREENKDKRINPEDIILLPELEKKEEIFCLNESTEEEKEDAKRRELFVGWDGYPEKKEYVLELFTKSFNFCLEDYEVFKKILDGESDLDLHDLCAQIGDDLEIIFTNKGAAHKRSLKKLETKMEYIFDIISHVKKESGQYPENFFIK